MDNILHYVEVIGKILATGLSLYAILWSLITVVIKFKEKMQIAIEAKDWEAMLNIISEFVTAVEQKYFGKEGVGAQKKAEVIELLKEAGYEVTNIVDALIEATVYEQFNWGRKSKTEPTKK